jgi:hypothetical protein
MCQRFAVIVMPGSASVLLLSRRTKVAIVEMAGGVKI